MDIRKVKKLIELLEESELIEMEIKEGEDSIRLSRAAVSVPLPVQQFTSAPAATVTASAADAPVTVETGLPDGHVVKSPMVGTYYSAANPDSKPFVEVGTVVSVGEPLCIVEAMKIFNQIESDYAGTVRAVFKKNGDPIEYGEALFVVE
ncbi:acetyl-CoA carboxylase biotin carboxyl carrier protein [Pseudomonadota bacterium]